jgi:SMC interacting uncharacterized protein involved in chromosome segregation
MILATIETALTIPNVVFTIGIIGTIFSVYFHFRKPQESSEIKQVITDKDLSTKATILAQKEVENKALLLAQQVEWEKQANEKKFVEFGLRLDNSMILASNHIRTVDIKVDKIAENVACMSIIIQQLTTIIDERIPRKN